MTWKCEDGYAPIGAKIDAPVITDSIAPMVPNCKVDSNPDNVKFDPDDRDYVNFELHAKIHFKGNGGLEQDLELFTEILYKCYLSLELPHIGYRAIETRMVLVEPDHHYDNANSLKVEIILIIAMILACFI